MIERPYDGCGRCLLGVRRLSRMKFATSSPGRVTTQAGDLEPAIPKLRAGSLFPFLGLLERRRRIDPCLFPGARAMA
ncbi:hypothetical protein DMH12_06155 [Streptomyces sp. WAC 04229]|uniref:transposase n=1 Tax=Streptomyces sp. WAC 04229 TaxID=2203206 RepID=UPI000F737194|nr:hypothetical protein DMH12_06155 [Streptomyces sp. WAC 04229]